MKTERVTKNSYEEGIKEFDLTSSFLRKKNQKSKNDQTYRGNESENGCEITVRLYNSFIIVWYDSKILKLHKGEGHYKDPNTLKHIPISMLAHSFAEENQYLSQK